MARYQVRINNVDKFDRAFYDTHCQACDDFIEEGEPIWRIREDQSTLYVCRSCSKEYGDTGNVQVG